MIGLGTVFEWQVATGVPLTTIKKRLVEIGIEVESRKKYSAQKIIEALFLGPERLAKTRNLELENEAMEREARKDDDNWINKTDAEKLMWHQILLPLQQELATMPARLTPQIQTNRESCLETLQDWVEQTKKMIGEKQK